MEQEPYQEQIGRLGKLATEFEEMTDNTQKQKAGELIRLLTEVHAQGIERMMEIISESGEPAEMLMKEMGNDVVVRALLLVYSLHPEALETRVKRAVEHMRSSLRDLACDVDLERVEEGAVRFRVKKGHRCGLTTSEVRAMVESELYECAPDVNAIEIVGLEDAEISGFVALESLFAPAMALMPSGVKARPGDAS